MVGRRAGDPVAIHADNRKAAEVLDWRPRFGIDEIVDTAWRWHSTHLGGYAG
jgi:UDP-glucose 4-epimerase